MQHANWGSNERGGRTLAKSLQELIKRCQQGDREAWQQLVERYHCQVEGHVRGILKRHNLAGFSDNHLQDIVNFVWKDLIENLHKYNSGEFEPWFAYRRVRRVIDYIRKELRHLPVDHDDQRKADYADSAYVNDPYRRLLLSQLGDKAEALPSKYSLMLKLYYRDGLSYKEIADALGLRPNSIGSLHTRALRKLRKI